MAVPGAGDPNMVEFLGKYDDTPGRAPLKKRRDRLVDSRLAGLYLSGRLNLGF
jgi:hypothetical protein